MRLYFLLLFIFVIILTIVLPGCQNKKHTADKSAGNVPTWINGYPLYEIYVRSFSEEGTFKGLEKRLPELKEYGIKNIWLMPIHPIGQKGKKGSLGCPYSVRDYFDVNSECGTKADFKSLVETVHKLDMKIIIDMVANHCANDYVEMINHPDWFSQDSSGTFTREVADWSDVTDWNFDNPEVNDYLEKAMLYWIEEYDIDGYRCDVAGMVPDDFWKIVIPKLRNAKKDIFMLAEWEDPRMYTDGFNSDYDWNLYHRMVLHNEGDISVDSLWEAVEWRLRSFPSSGLPLRFVENHDQERTMAVFGKDDYYLYAALVLTLPGIPLLYNGQETGEAHKPSLFEKEPILWKNAGESVKAFYKDILRIRDQEKMLREGEVKRIFVSDDERVLSFIRSIDRMNEVIVLNFSDESVSGKLPPDLAAESMLWDEVYSYPVSGDEKTEYDMQQIFTVAAKGFRIFKSK